MTEKTLGLSVLLVSVVIEALAQLTLKKGASASEKSHGGRWTVIGVSCFIASAILWTIVLKMLDVSEAYPMDALALVFVVLLSRLWLKEAVSRMRWIGVALVMCGTTLVGLS